MPIRIILFFILSGHLAYGQPDTAATRKYYTNGRLKLISIKHGADTVEYRSYFKNGRLRDSLWFVLQNRQEIMIETCKSYYSNGKLASVTYYLANPNEFTTIEYSKNGKLKFYEQRPTGLIKYYNKRGKQVRQYDLNKMAHVYLPDQYRNGQHLQNTSFATRIQAKKARLIREIDGKRATIRAGALVSITVHGDTNLMAHCLIEGFSKDSIYFSKFYYNSQYDGINDLDVLRYKQTFGLGVNQLRTLYYTRHANGRRRFGALAAFSIGFASLLVPMVSLPGTLRDINSGEANIPVVATGYGASAALGFSLILISKQLYKTTVPKKYNLQEWSLSLKK